jgi:cobalamin biosynthesis Mg chelatase CobN
MAYKRTTKTTKLRGGQGTIRQTTTRNSNNKITTSNSRTSGGVTTTSNSKGEVWQTVNQGGWITKRKIGGVKAKPAPKPRKPRRKKTTSTGNRSMAGVWLIGIVGLIIFFWLVK